MALVVKDRVKQTTTTTGTGSIVLNGTVDGFQTFTSALATGDTTYYAIVESSTNEWEVGLGTWTESTTTLARTTILESSNSGSAINLTAGEADVFITQPAEKAAYLDASGDLVISNDISTTTITTNSGGGSTVLGSNLDLGDNQKIRLGASDDLEIYHSGSYSYIKDLGTGGLYIDSNGPEIQLRSNGGAESMAKLVQNAQVELYYDGSKKLETGSTGAIVTGLFQTDSLAVNRTSASYELDVEGQAWIRGNTQGVDDLMYLGEFSDSISPFATVKYDDSTGDKFKININRWGADYYFTRNSQSGNDINMMRVEGSGTTNLRLYDQASPSTSTTTTQPVHITTNGSSYFNGGNVGIGTSSPAQKLDVDGNIAVTGTVDGRDIASDGSKLDGIEAGATADQNASEILTLIKTVDGSGSGLDSDLLDGLHASSFLRNGLYYNHGNDSNTYYFKVGYISGNNGSFKLWGLLGGHDLGSQGAASLDIEVFSRNGTVEVQGRVSGQTGNQDLLIQQDASNNVHIWVKSVTYSLIDLQYHETSGATSYYQPSSTTTAPTDTLIWSASANEATNNGETNILGELYVAGNRALTTADEGSGSGLDADTVDGIQAASFLRSDANDDFSGTLNYTPDTGTILSFDGQAVLRRLSYNGGMAIGHDDILILGAGEAADQMVSNTNAASEEVYIGGEGGIRFISSPDNWATSWAGRNEMVYNTSGDLSIPGALSATTKSFDIEHPTKEGMRLRYGSLEGPENGVYVRGRLKDNNTIELPDYWTGLVHEDTITVNLTAIGKAQDLWVEDIKDNKVIVGGDSINCFYTVYAERKDVERFDVEYENEN